MTNKNKIQKIDPLFDGHPEKRLKDMTPKEKIDYIWLCMEFKYKIRNRKFLGKATKDNFKK